MHPRAENLGLLLWLFYVNDMDFEGFESVKYTDDTTYYKTVRDDSEVSITLAIIKNQVWSEAKSALLNTEQTVIRNVLINHQHRHEEPVLLNNAISVLTLKRTEFLGAAIDNPLTFINHADSFVSKCNLRFILLRQLRIMGMNISGL